MSAYRVSMCIEVVRKRTLSFSCQVDKKKSLSEEDSLSLIPDRAEREITLLKSAGTFMLCIIPYAPKVTIVLAIGQNLLHARDRQ